MDDSVRRTVTEEKAPVAQDPAGAAHVTVPHSFEEAATNGRKRPNRRPRRWLKWLVGLLILAVVGGGGFSYRMAQSAGKLPPGVQVARVERRTLEQTITATGVVSAQTGAQVKIGAQLSGRIKQLRADVGQVVRPGDAIAELDLPEVEAQVRQARDNLAQAQSRHEQAMENAGLTRDQIEQEIRTSQSALNSADARLRSAAAAADWQPEQTKSDIQRADAALATAESQRRQVNASIHLQLNQAQAAIDAEQANLENTRQQHARMRLLHSRGYGAAEQVETLEAQVRQSRARLASAKANLGVVTEKTEADRKVADDAVRQAEASLAAAKSNSFQDRRMAAERDNAQHAHQQAIEQLTLAQKNQRQNVIRGKGVTEAAAAVRVAQSQLDSQMAQLNKTVIRSPIGGTVVSIAAQQGETVAAAFAAPTLIVVTDLNRLEVKAYVDETDVGRLRLGLPADVQVDSAPNRKFRGRVTKIASGSTVKDNVVTYETTIALDNSAGIMKPDMTASVDILLDRRPDVLSVPSEAVKKVGERDIVYVMPQQAPKAGGGFLASLKPGPGQKPLERTVKTGMETDLYSEVTQGVKEGETVVLAGLDKFGIQTGFTTRR